MSNIHGFGGAKKPNAADKKHEEFSVGGAQSGTAVLRPVKGAPMSAAGSNPNDPMAALVNAAKGNAGNPMVHDRNLGLITLYSNGFQIGNGAFRDIKEAKNAQFINDLKQGIVPQELEPELRKEWPDAKEVGIQLVNKSTQPYVPDPKAAAAKPKYDFKAGTGQSLGGASGSGSSAAGSAAGASFAAAKPKLYVCDESQPTTEVQLVSADRKTKTKVKFNQTATVLDVYQHVQALTGVARFELIGGAGLPKPLSNPSVTLKDGNLLGSSFQQRVAPGPSGAAAAGAGAKKK